MEQLSIPLNLQTDDGKEKAKLDKCKCVPHKRLRTTKKSKSKHQKPDLLTLPFLEDSNATS